MNVSPILKVPAVATGTDGQPVTHALESMPALFFGLRQEPLEDDRIAVTFLAGNTSLLPGLDGFARIKDIRLLLSQFPPEDGIQLAAALLRSAREMKPCRVEFRLKDGEGPALLELKAVPRRDEASSGAVEWSGFIHDVSERVQECPARDPAAPLREIEYEEILQLNRRLEDNARTLEEYAVELETSREQLKVTESWYRRILQSAPDGIMLVDERGVITLVNGQLEKMFGYTEAELIGQPMEMLIPPHLRREHVHMRAGFSSQMVTGIASRIANNLRGCRKDGSEFFVDVNISLLPENDEVGRVICAAVRDVTERRQMEAALAGREQEFRTLVENSPDTVARYGPDFRRLYANPALAAQVEGGVAALIGKKPSECPGGQGTVVYEQHLAEVFRSGKDAEFELVWRNKEGRKNYSLIKLTLEPGAHGKVDSVLAIGRDITELHASREKIHQMAFFDPLTALPNRSLFNDRLRQMLADVAWHGQLAGVMMIDVDRFTAVNDTLGHALGDELLREAATRLGACVRAYDTVARLGGDEFAILLPDVRNSDDLARIANKILGRFRERFCLGGNEIFVSCSVGIALYPNDGTAADDLVKFADSALYFAKESGRNDFRFYAKDLTVNAQGRLTLESELRHAIERKELELYYQPKVQLHNGEVVGSEALLRWRHPRLGMVSPVQFIPIAEETGMIVELGQWVLREACRTAAEWNSASTGKRRHKVAVNLSPRQFQARGLTEFVANTLKECGCRPEWIELEITESLLLDDEGRTLEILTDLRAMGITIAIDDFGTGYSALSYLNRFPIDTLKIDKSFIQSMTTDRYRAELVKAVLSIARCLKQQVVAEGVETVSQAAFLEANGCQIAQGFLYSVPLPKDQMAALPSHFRGDSALEDADWASP